MCCKWEKWGEGEGERVVMVGGGGAMMMCLFLVMVKTEEDMVFLQRGALKH